MFRTLPFEVQFFPYTPLHSSNNFHKPNTFDQPPSSDKKCQVPNSPGASPGYGRSRARQMAMDEYSFRLRWYGSLPL